MAPRNSQMTTPAQKNAMNGDVCQMAQLSSKYFLRQRKMHFEQKKVRKTPPIHILFDTHSKACATTFCIKSPTEPQYLGVQLEPFLQYIFESFICQNIFYFFLRWKKLLEQPNVCVQNQWESYTETILKIVTNVIDIILDVESMPAWYAAQNLGRMLLKHWNCSKNKDLGLWPLPTYPKKACSHLHVWFTQLYIDFGEKQIFVDVHYLYEKE